MNQPPNGQGYPEDNQSPGQGQSPPGSGQQGQPQQGYGQPQHGQAQHVQPQQATQGGPGYLPPGSPGLEPDKKDKTPIYIGVALLLVVLVGGGAIAFLATQSTPEVVTEAGGSTTLAETGAETGETTAGGSVVTQLPVTAKPATTAQRAIVRSTKPAAATTTAAAGATTQVASPTTVDVCGAGVGSTATGIVTGDPFMIAKVDTAGGERRVDLVLDAGDTVQIDVSMVDFDPVIDVVDSNGNVVAFNDDGPFGLNAQVIFTVATGGFHSVYVYAANAHECGLFEIEAIVVATGGGTPALSPSDSYSFVVSLSASLTQIDIELRAGDQLVIFVVDSGMGTDPFISLTTPTGAPFGFDDDGASGTEGPLDSLLVVTATESGTYVGFIESTNGVTGDAEVIVLIN